MFDAYTQSGLIEAKQLHDLLSQDDSGRVVILDASYYMAFMNKDGYARYKDRHIPEAQYFDIDEIAAPASDLPHMLPSADDFTQHAQNFGINKNSLVVIYGQEGMLMGPARAWWMFRVFGHDNVCLLNGGLPAWLQAHYETSKTVPSMRRGDFEASLCPDLVLDLKDMQTAQAQILDARPPGRFNGTEDEPRPGLKRGHIPGSLNVPCGMLVDGDSQKLKTHDELTAILNDKKINPAEPIIVTCGSGVTACVVAFALYHLGHGDIPVYDGSWSEWGMQESDHPVASNA